MKKFRDVDLDMLSRKIEKREVEKLRNREIEKLEIQGIEKS